MPPQKQQSLFFLLILGLVFLSENCSAQKKISYSFNYGYHSLTNHIDKEIKSGSGFSASVGVSIAQQIIFEFEYNRSYWGASKELHWKDHFFAGKGINLKIYFSHQRKFLAPYVCFGAGFGALNWENETTIFNEGKSIKNDRLTSLFFHPDLGIEIMVGEKALLNICGRVLFNHWEDYSEQKSLSFFTSESFGHIVVISLGITYFI
jgi:hypothetical protein